MGNARTLEVMVIPTGGLPYRKTLEVDTRGSFLHGLQACVGGPIEPAGYIFGDAPSVYVNEEGLLTASLDTANRAIYATREMAEMGYLSQMDYSHAVEEGELYSIVFGNMVCVGFDRRGPRHHRYGGRASHGALRQRGVDRVWRC